MMGFILSATSTPAPSSKPEEPGVVGKTYTPPTAPPGSVPSTAFQQWIEGLKEAAHTGVLGTLSALLQLPVVLLGTLAQGLVIAIPMLGAAVFFYVFGTSIVSKIIAWLWSN